MSSSTKYAADEENYSNGNGLKWLIPVLLLALLGAGALYYFKNGDTKETKAGMHTDAAEGAHETMHADPDTTANMPVMNTEMKDSTAN